MSRLFCATENLGKGLLSIVRFEYMVNYLSGSQPKKNAVGIHKMFWAPRRLMQRTLRFVIVGLGFIFSTALVVVIFGDAQSSAAEETKSFKGGPTLAELREGRAKSVAVENKWKDFRGFESALKILLKEKYPKEDWNKTINVTIEDLYIAWVDLNDDGIDEAVIAVEEIGYCGTIGCDALILGIENNTLLILGNPTLGGIAIGPPRHEGYLTVYSGDTCAIWTGRWYSATYDNRNDSENIHPHACGKNYTIKTASARQSCADCHALPKPK